MVKTAEKDAATSPESPFFDPPCGIEKSGGSVIAQLSRKQQSVSMARWYLTQCACRMFSGRDFLLAGRNPKVHGSRRLRFASGICNPKHAAALYKRDVPPC